MKGKILVVDDEKPIADILKYYLEREGFEVSVAYDGLKLSKVPLRKNLIS